MLTQEQKDSLTQLMNDCPIPKLKRVLEEGLPRFISGEITPIQNNSGVSLNQNDIYHSLDKECCLLGVAAIGKKSNESFSLELGELYALTSSFDGKKFRIDCDKEIFDYVAQIRKVIFGC
jgi:hypothetical protein